MEYRPIRQPLGTALSNPQIRNATHDENPRTVGLSGSLVVLATFPAVSRACDAWQGSLLGARAFGYSGTMYGLGYVPVPPYFALHPPVYYGHRYYRSYGESPFARPPVSSRPQRFEAQLVINPFVKDVARLAPPAGEAAETPVPEAPEREDQATAGPLMIVNPFYDAGEEVARRFQ